MSASPAGLSRRQRRMRGKRTATPLLCRVRRLDPLERQLEHELRLDRAAPDRSAPACARAPRRPPRGSRRRSAPNTPSRTAPARRRATARTCSPCRAPRAGRDPPARTPAPRRSCRARPSTSTTARARGPRRTARRGASASGLRRTLRARFVAQRGERVPVGCATSAGDRRKPSRPSAAARRALRGARRAAGRECRAVVLEEVEREQHHRRVPQQLRRRAPCGSSRCCRRANGSGASSSVCHARISPSITRAGRQRVRRRDELRETRRSRDPRRATRA